MSVPNYTAIHPIFFLDFSVVTNVVDLVTDISFHFFFLLTSFTPLYMAIL